MDFYDDDRLEKGPQYDRDSKGFETDLPLGPPEVEFPKLKLQFLGGSSPKVYSSSRYRVFSLPDVMATELVEWIHDSQTWTFPEQKYCVGKKLVGVEHWFEPIVITHEGIICADSYLTKDGVPRHDIMIVDPMTNTHTTLQSNVMLWRETPSELKNYSEPAIGFRQAEFLVSMGLLKHSDWTVVYQLSRTPRIRALLKGWQLPNHGYQWRKDDTGVDLHNDIIESTSYRKTYHTDGTLGTYDHQIEVYLNDPTVPHFLFVLGLNFKKPEN